MLSRRVARACVRGSRATSAEAPPPQRPRLTPPTLLPPARSYPARPSKASLREQLFGDVLYGVAPVLAALRAGRRAPHALYVQEGADAAKRKDGRAFEECLELARAAGAAVKPSAKHDLNMLAGNRPHQGLLLDCSPLEWLPMDRLPDASDASAAQAEGGAEAEGGEGGSAGGGAAARFPIWLALDEVVDPVRRQSVDGGRCTGMA